MQGQGRLIAVCGIDCTDCDIRRVPIDTAASERVVAWFRQKGWLEEDEGVPEIIERSMYCQGCRGERSVHWSPDCRILHCCVDKKGLTFCYECDDFVCEQLNEWAQQGAKYAQALEHLRGMRESRTV